MSTLTEDKFFTQLFQQGLNDSNGDFYLPKLIEGASNPKLEPYSAGSADLGDLPVLDTTIHVTLSGITVAGLSNLQIPADGLSITNLNVTFTADFSKIDPPPSGSSQYIVVHADFKATNPDAGTLLGSFTLTIKASTLAGDFDIEGQDLTVIETAFSSLSVSAPTTSDNVTASVSIDNGGTFWNSYLSDMMEKSEVVKAVLDNVNQNVKDNLTKISTSISNTLQSIVRSKL